jgi:2-dehydro-3-deoxyglucarate aldolase/4-hydroxy-2-oxoheptanedioate aldolase
VSLNNIEKFRKSISDGRLCIGTGVSFSDVVVSELAAEAGYDFTFIDMEHSALSLEQVQAHILALRGTDTAPFVRVPWNDAVTIKQVLEFAPAAIIVPMVNDEAEAARAVAACKYPPVGMRSFGPRRGVHYGAISTPEYLKTADQNVLVIVQIEHIKAVRNLDAILAVPGIDGICVGPNDLAASMNQLGHSDNRELTETVRQILQKSRRANKMAGLGCSYDPEAIRRLVSDGIQWLLLGGDWGNLFIQHKTLIDGARTLLRKERL